MLRRVSPLAGDTILPLADAKLHLRVRHSEEDALIGSLRDAAVTYVERAAGFSLAPASFTWTVARVSGGIALPVRPATAVTAVSTIDDAGTSQPYTGARLLNGAAYPASSGAWPTSYGPVTVTFTAGFASLADASDLLAAVKVKLQALYDREQGEGSGEHYNRAIEALIAPLTVVVA